MARRDRKNKFEKRVVLKRTVKRDIEPFVMLSKKGSLIERTFTCE